MNDKTENAKTDDKKDLPPTPPNPVEEKFYKVTDLDGNIFTLATVTNTGDTFLIEHNSAAERAKARKIKEFNQSEFNGPVTEIDKAEYDKICSDWGLSVEEKEKIESGNDEDMPASETGETVGDDTDPQKIADKTKKGKK